MDLSVDLSVELPLFEMGKTGVHHPKNTYNLIPTYKNGISSKVGVEKIQSSPWLLKCCLGCRKIYIHLRRSHPWSEFQTPHFSLSSLLLQVSALPLITKFHTALAFSVLWRLLFLPHLKQSWIAIFVPFESARKLIASADPVTVHQYDIRFFSSKI